MRFGGSSSILEVPGHLFREATGTHSSNHLAYQFQAQDVDVGSMLQTAHNSLQGRIAEFTDRTMRSNIWSNQPNTLSLRNVENLESRFERIYGSMCIPFAPSEIRQDTLREFFQQPGRIFSRLHHYETRGLSYYVARDPNLSPLEKLNSIEQDVRAVHRVLANVERESLNSKEYLYYLAALDYLKAHSMTLYQVLTHAERNGSISMDNEYNFVKGLLLDTGKDAVNAYFQHALGYGLKYSQQLEWHSSAMEHTFGYLREELERELGDSRRFKLQESDHPMVIGLNAHENALKFPNTDVIVALPLGGLQPAFVTQFAFSVLYNREPKMITVPLSMHSGQETNSRSIPLGELTRILLQTDVKGKKVLVTEDNSNTGQTARVISEALTRAGAEEVHIALVELDVTRVLLKQSMEKPSQFVANLNHPDFVTAVRSVPIAQEFDAGIIGIQMIKRYADRIIRKSYERINGQRPDWLDQREAEAGIKKYDFWDKRVRSVAHHF